MCVGSGRNTKRNKMDEITKQEDLNKRQEILLNKIDGVLEDIDAVLPPNWTKNQVAVVFSTYMEFYK